MLQIDITSDAYQTFELIFQEDLISFDVFYCENVQSWYCNVAYKEKEIRGIRLVLGTLHFLGKGLPFDLLIGDNQNLGLDPFKLDDFTERCSLYLLEPEEMRDIRGVEVEI